MLIVDDQRMFADALAALFELDHRVQVVGTATDAREALALAASQPVDVALVDLVMPGPDGVQLAAELRVLHPNVRIVLVSGRPEADLRVRAEEAGAAAFLRKGSLGAEVADVVVQVAQA